VAATIACLLLPSAPPAPAAPGTASRALHEPVRQLREGFAAIKDNREVSRPLLHLAAAASLVGVLGVLGPALAASIGLEPERLIVVVLPLGLGVVGGVLGLRRLARGVPRRRTAEAGLVGFGLLSIGVAIVGPSLGAQGLAIPVVVVLAFLAGAAYAATTVSAQTALFEHMPAPARGRIFGVLASIVSAASLLPILIAGPLADKVSASVVLVIVGAAVVATGMASARLFGPTDAEPDAVSTDGP
jgi:MFS family permease